MPEDLILNWISTYGYAALYLLLLAGIVGLPIPDETLLVISGYLVFREQLQPIPTLLFAFLGSSSGITISYTLGRTLGPPLIHRCGGYIGLTEERWNLVHQWFARFGGWTLMIGYFVPGVRHFTALVAGASTQSFAWFAAFAIPGALVWVSTFLLAGYLLGENWSRAIDTLHRSGLLVLTVFAVLTLLVFGVYRWRSRTSRR